MKALAQARRARGWRTRGTRGGKGVRKWGRHTPQQRVAIRTRRQRRHQKRLKEVRELREKVRSRSTRRTRRN
jgi:hypothetical protein